MFDKYQAYSREINPSSHRRACFTRTMIVNSQQQKSRRHSGRESQGARSQEELIGGKPQVVKQLGLWL
jgi:hypothetical protein